jgi:hypothetical protein
MIKECPNGHQDLTEHEEAWQIRFLTYPSRRDFILKIDTVRMYTVKRTHVDEDTG